MYYLNGWEVIYLIVHLGYENDCYKSEYEKKLVPQQA